MPRRRQRMITADFVIKIASLVFSIVAVSCFYSRWVHPEVDRVQTEASRQMAQNPQDYVAPRSLAIMIKDPEQACEITLALWAMLLLTWKFRQLGHEFGMLDLDYVTPGRGEGIRPEDALGFFKKLRARMDGNPRWRGRILPEIILTALNRFHATRSIQDTVGAISARAEVAANALEADHALIRTAAWGIPAIGFIGTVRGLGEALAHAQRSGGVLGVTDALAPAFNAALVALLLSTVLMSMTHLVKSRQDKLILEAQNFCHENIVAQMKEPARESEAQAYRV